MTELAGRREALSNQSFISDEQAKGISAQVEEFVAELRQKGVEVSDEKAHQFALLLALRLNQPDMQGLLTLPNIMSARDWLCENFGSRFPEFCRDA